MRILLLGAGGFLGRNLAARLTARGHEVIPCGRDLVALRRRFPGCRPVAADLGRDDADRWAPRLAGVEAVVNAAGLLRGPLDAVHHRGPAALFEACAAARIPRLVQISALGADPDAATAFLRSKGRADAHLLGLRAGGARTGWCVVRPALVIGRGGGSTALFSALAALPRPLRLGPGTWPVQPIHVADLCRAVAELLEAPGPVPAVLDAAGPEAMGTDALTAALRRWLDLPEARPVPFPAPLLRGAARLGALMPRAALTPDTLRMLRAGSTASTAPFRAALGWTPRPLAEALALDPAEPAARWHARLLPLQPALRGLLAAVWIGGGAVSAAVASRPATQALLEGLSIRGGAATAVIWAGALLDLAIGAALLLAPRHTARVALASLAVLLAYTALATLSVPAAWADPFGPLVKNFAVLGLTLALLATRE